MFDTQTGQYSGLLRRYVVQQISALTNPTSAERQQNLRPMAKQKNWIFEAEPFPRCRIGQCRQESGPRVFCHGRAF